MITVSRATPNRVSRRPSTEASGVYKSSSYQPTPSPLKTEKSLTSLLKRDSYNAERRESSSDQTTETVTSRASNQSDISFLIESLSSSPELPPISEEKKEEIQKPQTRTRKPPPPKRVQRKNIPLIPRKQQRRADNSFTVTRPLMKEELREMQDPLDYLSKYCIIHKNRLPAYDVAFKRVVSLQECRYPDNESLVSMHMGFADRDREDPPIPETKMDVEDRLNLEKRIETERATYTEMAGRNVGEKLLAKTEFVISELHKRQDAIRKEIHESQSSLTTMIATIIRKEFSEEYLGTQTKRSKRSRQMTAAEFSSATDRELVKGLNTKLYRMILGVPSIQREYCTLKRKERQLSDATSRLRQVEREREEYLRLGEDHFTEDIGKNKKPEELRRRQSMIYQKLNPDLDVEMNLEDLEGALQSLNNNLLTQKECEYVYQILNLPTRSRVNMKLFSCVAALSEKISQMEPIVRKLINKFDFEALQWKLDKCKELFYLLDDQDVQTPKGTVAVQSLLVELMAGGLSHENVASVMTKFDRERKGFVEFLDYLTYVPLFIEIHQRIICDPFDEQKW